MGTRSSACREGEVTGFPQAMRSSWKMSHSKGRWRTRVRTKTGWPSWTGGGRGRTKTWRASRAVCPHPLRRISLEEGCWVSGCTSRRNATRPPYNRRGQPDHHRRKSSRRETLTWLRRPSSSCWLDGVPGAIQSHRPLSSRHWRQTKLGPT
jgi:hypothetical protein